MTASRRVLAVDMGASSVRVAAVGLGTTGPQVEILHRWHNGPIEARDGSLRWDWPQLVAEVGIGLARGISSGPVDSIGVDGWGVDYGVVDGNNELLSLPFSYRDGRTDSWRSTAAMLGVDQLYRVSGIQLMAINTIFQLAAHDRDELRRAKRIMLLPDLLVGQLGDHHGAERSNASTTGLVDAHGGDWSEQLIEALGLDRSQFPDLVAAPRRVGRWRGVPLHLVGSHDTASAFLGMPGGSDPGTVFVSAGTWMIVGVERPEPDVSDRARDANFSNEVGALGGFRFLKNVAGLWIIERCRPGWGDPPIDVLVAEAANVKEPVPRFDATDHRFVNPEDMEREVRSAAGLSAAAPRAVVVRSVLESIADAIASVVDQLGGITGVAPTQLSVAGGGARVGLLQQMLGARTGLPVIKGSSEATALGNAIVQGIAIGRFPGVEEARSWVAETGEVVSVTQAHAGEAR